MSKSNKKKTFLKKLIAMLENKDYEKYICWNKEGKVIIIKDEKKFSEIVLPNCFSHNNFSSFVRQLNLYNFKGKRHKDGKLRYENIHFYKNISNEEIENMEEKDSKTKKSKLIRKNNKIQNIENPENIINISNEKIVDFNEFRGKLDKCLNEIEEILNCQKQLYKEIETIKNEKSKGDNNLNNYFKNPNKDIITSNLSLDNNEKVNKSIIINNIDDNENIMNQSYIKDKKFNYLNLNNSQIAFQYNGFQ